MNNALGAGLLALTAIICGYGSDRTGTTLLLSGAALLAVAACAKRRTPEADVAGAYLAQGLALATGGVMIVFMGTTRARAAAGRDAVPRHGRRAHAQPGADGLRGGDRVFRDGLSALDDHGRGAASVAARPGRRGGDAEERVVDAAADPRAALRVARDSI